MKFPVLIPNICDHPFTYTSEINLKVGDYVEVPFGKKKVNGVVWNNFEQNQSKEFKLKKILRKLDVNPLKKTTIDFLNWFSKYNIVPKGMALKLHLLSNQAIENKTGNNFNEYNSIIEKSFYKLNNEQLKCFTNLSKKNNKFCVNVLQGTTGSGKTLVYFNLIKDKIKQNKQALILLPEIGLTGEFEKKFIDFFGFKPAIWHSSVTPKNKKNIWNGLCNGSIKAVIGARSSLFLPFKNLGVIIVDEEHDQSFKQDEGVTYNARDMAISRAYYENIPVNLISAVPSIETYNNIIKGKYFSHRILKRYKNARLPDYELIDLTKERRIENSLISEKIISKVENHLKENDQVLFFVNRRGYSPFVICKKCLKSFTCPRCSINLVYHKKINKILCHYCGYKNNLETICMLDNEKCEFIFSGLGVEKILEEVKKNFPGKKTVIFSSDTINKKNSQIEIQRIIDNETKILVGTQLISKGFHFPNLNCIVILDIDLASRGFDIRSVEKTVQLYHQLSGRAGREGKPSKVYFQTINKKNNMISQITNPDPYIFLEKELELRKKFKLPPFERFVSIIISCKDAFMSEKTAFDLVTSLKKKTEGNILGPVNAPIYKIRGKYRNRILIRSSKNINIQGQIQNTIKNFKLPPQIKLSVDVDPINFN
ncbi:primosomal protein N' [Candidatus Pelagibacter sp.]|nr:primosomal protein N' [Candidatus Pelagibacter sp.]